MDKKAQAQIITVVLIILLVLAAIVIVWQVIKSTVQESAAEVAGGTECITLDLVLTKYTAGDTTISVKRGSGAGNLAQIKVLIDGNATTTETVSLNELETTLVNVGPGGLRTIASTEKIEIAGIISTSDGGTKLCDVADTKTVL